ncbi:MAG: DUF6701 domain-containing protein [Thermodesulfobacteriota bacterium]
MGFIVLAELLFLPHLCQAARTINSVTLNGSTTVTVPPDATITAVVNVSTGGAGNDDWFSTGWRIATTSGAMTNCVDHANHVGSGSYQETFTITAPSTDGTYNAYFTAYNNETCTSGASAVYTRNNGVVVDGTPPTVSSINRDAPDPTSLASVTWTAVFSEAVTGVDSTDFSLIPGGGVTGAAITGVSGSGTTWTITASTGTGNGTLGLNLTDNNSIIDTAGNPLGGTAIGDGNFSGQFYTVDRNCYTDAFDGNLPDNWSVGRASGTFTPQIVNGRLRLSNTSTSVGTWATLQRIFPGAGNKMTVEFDHFAYGGTGADGIAAIISNAAVAPQAGAFGGSMGYAQKGEYPVSDCTTIGGCPGFAGGWLGIGIDEYGNFSTALEGRVGGLPSLLPDSVAIRGSGAGMSGYRYLVGTGSLTPQVDNNGTATPPHRYRITVDFTDNVHTWVSVERDTSGGGTSYTTLLGCAPGQTSGCTPIDVNDAGYSQDLPPIDGYLSFTSASGALTNIHEIDNLKVCTHREQVTPVLHHIRLLHESQACTGTSNPAEITVKACANEECTSLYLDRVDVDLSSTGGTWSADPIAFTGGQATVTLSSTSSTTVTLSAIATSPLASSATRCFDGAIESCSLTFSPCTFDVIEPGASAYTPIYTKLSGASFNLDVYYLGSSTQNVPVNRVEIVDGNSAATCSAYTSLADTTTSLPLNFSRFTRRRTLAFNYANAARDARIRVTYGDPAQYSCSSDNFAIRPQSFAVTSNATQSGSTGTPVFRAGQDPFSLTATALPGYDGMPKLNAARLSSALPNLGLFGTATFPFATKSTGVSTATGLTYSEVGNFNLDQYGVYDDGFTAVDATKPQPECTSDFNNGPPVNDRYGCMFGLPSTAGPFGRFVPDHFTVVGQISNGCASGAFTYMGQPFPLARSDNPTKAEVVEARNSGNQVTKNYAGAYAHGTVSFGAENADNGTDLSSRFVFYSSATYPSLSGTWTNGVFTLASNNTHVSFKRPTVLPIPDGPFASLDLGLTVSDSDVSTLPLVSDADMNPSATGGTLTYKKFSGIPIDMRFGRLVLQNAYGPETEDHTVPFQIQFYANSGQWLTNPNDNCTSFSTGNFYFSNYLQQLASDEMNSTHIDASLPLPSSSLTVSGGRGFLYLTRPSAGDGRYVGSVDVCVDLWQDTPSAGSPPAPNTAPVCVAASSATMPWLQGRWTEDLYDDDPISRVNFGISRGNDRIINWREIMR